MKKFYCPVNGWDCPYWENDGSCKMVNEGADPTLECDDAYTFWSDEAGDGSYFVEEKRQEEIAKLTENLRKSPFYNIKYLKK